MDFLKHTSSDARKSEAANIAFEEDFDDAF